MRYRREHSAATLIAIGLSFHWGIALGAGASTAQPDAPRQAKIWIGYGHYRMDDFNRAQVAQGNKKLTDGFNAGIEFSPLSFKVPEKIPLLSSLIGGASLSLPLGLEYLSASTKTTHTLGGNSATVAWNLPVVGIYVAPEIALSAPGWLTLQPLTIGYYSIGNPLDANLTINDRPGRLRITAGSVGARSEITIKPFQDKMGLFMSIGYRWLRFSDVKQEPRDGFQYSVGGTFSPPGSLQHQLDYSGFVARIGVARSF